MIIAADRNWRVCESLPAERERTLARSAAEWRDCGRRRPLDVFCGRCADSLVHNFLLSTDATQSVCGLAAHLDELPQELH